MDGAFAEDGGLGRNLFFVVIVFQRQEQWQIRVTEKCPLVYRRADRAEAVDKTVIDQIELETCIRHLFLVAAVEL